MRKKSIKKNVYIIYNLQHSFINLNFKIFEHTVIPLWGTWPGNALPLNLDADGFVHWIEKLISSFN